jgi:hypothetical protein
MTHEPAKTNSQLLIDCSQKNGAMTFGFGVLFHEDLPLYIYRYLAVQSQHSRMSNPLNGVESLASTSFGEVLPFDCRNIPA